MEYFQHVTSTIVIYKKWMYRFVFLGKLYEQRIRLAFVIQIIVTVIGDILFKETALTFKLTYLPLKEFL